MQEATRTHQPAYQVRCQIVHGGRCVTDHSYVVGANQESRFTAPDFVAIVTVHGCSNAVISFTAALESGYRYVTPDLDVVSGGTSVLDFYGHSARITVTLVDG